MCTLDQSYCVCKISAGTLVDIHLLFSFLLNRIKCSYLYYFEVSSEEQLVAHYCQVDIKFLCLRILDAESRRGVD